ncbi:PREDICTED: uncharacterized protein LOC104587825 [Nelumbo nucifera]|uniref:Uncharacterized protein LOC104587825 n=1 Tax=Nelumbo nucifera TaxID=4432 RepID=A0A1U7Z8A0_NELNU|nr:PREDICTED: uncharacterized protein LOC104587825 [Nelumbo nucifera]
MNDDYSEEKSCCYFHPKAVIVGVCALCLKERLLILAAKQGHIPLSESRRNSILEHRKFPITLPKIFALGSLLNRLEFLQPKSADVSDDDYLSTSPEDSFISIKFEDNGVASWDKGTSSRVSNDLFHMHCNQKLSKEAREVKAVVEHNKPRATLRWRKRIGHLLQIIRWKRSNKSNVCHVGSKVEGVKVRKGWIRTLTKRRTME